MMYGFYGVNPQPSEDPNIGLTFTHGAYIIELLNTPIVLPMGRNNSPIRLLLDTYMIVNVANAASNQTPMNPLYLLEEE